MNAATLEVTLRRLGETSVIAPDLDALEARLLAAIDGPPAPVDLAERRRRRAGTVLIGATAACLLALVVLAAGWFAGGDDPYVLAAAVDVEVVLPDGDVVVGTAGLELPIGSVLNVGGSMEIDGRTYGPGDYVITDDGPAAVGEAGGDGGGRPLDGGGDGGDGGIPVTGTSTTVPERPDAGAGTPATTPPSPPTSDRPTTTVRDRPTTTVRDRPTTTTAPEPPPRATTTTAPPRDVPPRDPPPRETTTTGPSRDQP